LRKVFDESELNAAELRMLDWIERYKDEHGYDPLQTEILHHSGGAASKEQERLARLVAWGFVEVVNFESSKWRRRAYLLHRQKPIKVSKSADQKIRVHNMPRLMTLSQAVDLAKELTRVALPKKGDL
jgi:hypothetical protein